MADVIQYGGTSYPVPAGSTPAETFDGLKAAIPELQAADLQKKGSAEGGGHIYVPHVSVGTKG